MKIKILNYGYKNTPKRAHDNDAGADVYALENYAINPGATRKIPLGFGLQLPDGFAGFILPRSSMGSKGITCEACPVDSGYTGEIHAIITNHSSNTYNIYEGDRIGQLVVVPCVLCDFVTEFGEARKDGAFGSTGK